MKITLNEQDLSLVIKKIINETIMSEPLSLEQLKNKYPEMIFTLEPSPRFKERYFARADIKTQNGTTEYLGALRGPVSLENGLEFLNNVAKNNYDKYN